MEPYPVVPGTGTANIIFDTGGAFPTRLEGRLPGFAGLDQSRKYVIYRECYADVILDPDECAIGRTRCSKCRETIEPFDKYCSHCGAKVKKRRLLKKKAKTEEVIICKPVIDEETKHDSEKDPS